MGVQLGLTPLHIAVTDSQLDVVSCLLELGASPFTTTKTGENKGGNKRFSRPGGSKQSSVAFIRASLCTEVGVEPGIYRTRQATRRFTWRR